MKRKIGLFGCLFIFSLIGCFAAKNEISMTNANLKKAKNPILKTLIITDQSKEAFLFKYEHTSGIFIETGDFPGEQKLLKKKLEKYINRSFISESTISKITGDIHAFYKSEGRPFIEIQVPSQKVTSGILQLIVYEGKIDKISIEGNKYFKSKNLLKKISLKPGDFINTEVLADDLYWINRNPFRTAQAVYSPGRKTGTTDIEIFVNDRRAFRIYTGIENRGNDVTGNNRPFVGINFGNVFYADQLLSYQFTSSDKVKRFQAHTVNYSIPLLWRHMLNIYGGYSHVDTDFSLINTGAPFHTSGFGMQTSMRYDIPFKSRRNLLHELTWGFDFKRTNNTLDFGGIPVSGKVVNLTQFMLGYNLGYSFQTAKISWEIEGFASPGRWVSDQSNERYQSLRPGARNQYIYFRTSLGSEWAFWKDASLNAYLRGQYASQNLLPSEEYGLGGYDTVRGYKEREVNMDNVVIFNLELHAPSVSLADVFRKYTKLQDKLVFLGFFDLAWGKAHKAEIGENKEESLMGIGPGVRYSIGPYLIIKADYGFQLKSLGSASLGGADRRLHFSALIGF